MMKAVLFLLFAVLIPAKYASAQTCCSIDHAIDGKIKAAVDSRVTAALSKVQMACTSVSARGAYVSCPSDYKATSCACGMACGSWDISGDSTCHCQCANIDWTSGRCCKLLVVG